MLFDREEFESQLPGTVFALSREEWEESPAFDALVQDRLNRQQERSRRFFPMRGLLRHLSGQPGGPAECAVYESGLAKNPMTSPWTGAIMT